MPLGQKIADTTSDILRMLAGRATPQGLREEHAAQGQQMAEHQAFQQWKQSPEGQKYLAGGGGQGIETQKHQLENQQLKETVAKLATEGAGAAGTLKATGGLSPEGYNLTQIQKPESVSNIGYRTAVGEQAGAETKSIQQKTGEAQRTEQQLGQTPEAFAAKSGRMASAGHSLDAINMTLQSTDPKNRAAMLAGMKMAGFDTSGLEQTYGSEAAAKKKNLGDILALDKQKPEGTSTKFSDTKGGHLLSVLKDYLPTLGGGTPTSQTPTFQDKLRGERMQKQQDFNQQTSSPLNPSWAQPDARIVAPGAERIDPIELLKILRGNQGQ